MEYMIRLQLAEVLAPNIKAWALKWLVLVTSLSWLDTSRWSLAMPVG